MDRRIFLQLVTGGTIVVALPSLNLIGGGASSDISYSTPKLLSDLSAGDLVRELGREYRLKFPDEDDSDTLMDRLSSSLDNQIIQDKSSIGVGILSQIQDDFASNNIVLLDGWILSVTEARQCALNSILFANRHAH